MKMYLPTKIKSKDDIRKLSYDLIYKYKVNYHCEEGFENIIDYKTSKKTFTDEQANKLNNLMDQCLKVDADYTFEIALNHLKLYPKQPKGN
tara:strand:+ start:50 stop:322 length:273 start_codon:yes stop_codon:yes gene_type:complete